MIATAANAAKTYWIPKSATIEPTKMRTGAHRVRPSLIVRLFATLLANALARLGHMHAAAEILDIGRIGRGGAGLLGVRPGLLIRRLAGCFVERDDALARLRYVGAGAEVLQICRIGGDGAGLLGIGPGLFVGVLARLLIRPLLLLLCPLRIRGLAASRREGSRGNDCNDRQFRKCDAPSVPGLLKPILAHAWPFFPGFTRGPLYLQRPRASPVQYVPKRRDGQKMADRAFTDYRRRRRAGGSQQLWRVPRKSPRPASQADASRGNKGASSRA